MYPRSLVAVRSFDRQFSSFSVKPLYEKVKAGTIHSWTWFKNGSLLFRKNAEISHVLLRKNLKGDELNYREHKLLVRTTSDILKLIPFSFFVIVPFAELALPIVLKLFPNLLPSSFDANKLFSSASGSTAAIESERSRRMRAKKELFHFFQEVSIRKDVEDLNEKKLAEKQAVLEDFKKYLVSHQSQNLSTSKGFVLPDVAELEKFAVLFQEQFRLENMNMDQLECICHLVSLTPYSFRAHVIMQLKKHVNEIRREDRNISWEGIESLTVDELVEANRKRAMPYDYPTVDQLMSQLRHWIDLSSNKHIPISLLLLSRALFVTENLGLLGLDMSQESTIPLAASPSPESMHISKPEQVTVVSTDNIDDTTIRIRKMSEEVMVRISELEKLEQESILNGDSGPAPIPSDAKPGANDIALSEYVKLMEDQAELIKTQLLYLNRIRKLKRLKRVDIEHNQIRKLFQVESKRLEEQLKRFKQE